MSVRLHISGADSDPVLPFRDVPVPSIEYATLEEARDYMYRYVNLWLADGYHQTPAGIFVKGSLWCRAVVIDENFIQWFPHTGVALDLSYRSATIGKGN